MQNQSGNSEYNTSQKKSDTDSASMFQDSISVGDQFLATIPQTTLTDHLPPSKLDLLSNQVPKLTLKLGEKLPYFPKEADEGERNSRLPNTTDLTLCQIKREHSPELARFAPLVTGPPKPKQSNFVLINELINLFNFNSVLYFR